MNTKEEAYRTVQALVKRFEEQLNSYSQADYNETLTRRDFIDPFFKALGWDIDNSQGYAEAYREVIHEDKVKVGKATKAPDYSFRLPGGKRLFFVEAKKPSVTVKDDIFVAYQIRRYGWSAKLPISIITDFEEFAVYDCTKRPQLTDKAGVARIKFINFKDYLNEFDYLWETFSKEYVLKGSFDRYIQSDTVKKGTATVDKEFLSSLDKWRTYLATTISLRNKDLDEEEINYVVQQTINRFIFLRIAEDRGVEQYGQLKNSVNQKGEAYQNLFYNFKRADEKYNSGLFDFKKDIISKTLQIDNKVIKSIVNEIYYPECPYEFSVISVEILGSVYEQFLGKVIRVTPAHHAKIEEKPEVRKAGGVYYTPQYVVDYIVKNTVGILIEGKTPKQIEKIKIVDPACGSGSFLIGAYQFLLDYHKNFYNENGTKAGKKNSPTTLEGSLTSGEKKRILLNNIFGVDIDVNAVEVTKLSLLLKCMEGETETTIAQQQKLWHDRILPTLDENIKSGNSIIDTDYYDSVIDFGEGKKIKPFNWQKGFPEIFKQGGFDVVIGNPPFIQLSSYSETTNTEKSYLISKYKSSMGRLNTFGFFTKRGIDLIYEKCFLGFIIPNTITTQDYYEELRKMILDSCKIESIINFDKLPFKDAVVENVILILQKTQSEKERNNTETSIVQVDAYNSFAELNKIKQSLFTKSSKHTFNIHLTKNDKSLKNKIEFQTVRLGDFLEVNQAIALKSDRSLWVSDKKRGNDYKPLLVGGKAINRYSLDWDGTYLKYDLNGIHSCKREDIFLTKEKILFRRVADRLIATLDTNMYYGLHTLVVMNLKNDIKENIRYFLGLFNSTLLNYYYKTTFASSKTVFSEVGARQVKELPIKMIDFKNKTQKLLYDDIIKLVDLLLNLKNELKKEKLSTKIEQIKQRIEYSDERINKLVYQLYELTEDEIKTVEAIK